MFKEPRDIQHRHKGRVAQGKGGRLGMGISHGPSEMGPINSYLIEKSAGRLESFRVEEFTEN